MLSYQHCQKTLFEQLDTIQLNSEEIALDSCVGRVLSQDLFAPESNPRFDHSAMDGYAIRLDLLNRYQNEQGFLLPVADCFVAGEEIPHLSKDAVAVEIMTGAPLPSPHFCSVVPLEEVEVIEQGVSGKWIQLFSAPNPKSHIRYKGEDIQKTTLLLEAGTTLKLHHLMVFANLGITSLPVIRQVRVALASTGRELVDAATKNLSDAQIRNATGPYLKAYLKTKGCTVNSYGILPDNVDAYRSFLIAAFETGHDLLISTGAVSMGKHDFVREALEGLGARIHFHKSAIRPGKPILFATLLYNGRKRFIFGIPGNMAASAVGLRFFVVPFLQKLMHLPTPEPVHAELLNDVKKPLGVRCFFSAELIANQDSWKVSVPEKRSPAFLRPFLKANVWAVFKEEEEFLPKGSLVEIFTL